MNEAIVVRDPEILGGIPVFKGTRVPLRHLLDYLEDDSTVDEFLEDFPTVTRSQMIAFLEQASEKMTNLELRDSGLGRSFQATFPKLSL